jgi:gluconolactonase
MAKWVFVVVMAVLLVSSAKSVEDTDAIKAKAVAKSVVASGAKVEKLCGGFAFTEGATSDSNGNVYFTDIPKSRIHKWSVDGKISTFLENSGGCNGLYSYKDKLIACADGKRQLVQIDTNGNVEVLADEFEGKKFNSPNDLWVDKAGGIYFTDPRYSYRGNMEMGEHVYYFSPDRKKLIRVIDDMVRPNGIIGSGDGKKLFVADHGGGKVFVYDIAKDGSLSGKKLFVAQGSDGMEIDERGNIYLTGKDVSVYNKDGEKIETITAEGQHTNLCFGGKDKKTLFITANGALYSVRMDVKGL